MQIYGSEVSDTVMPPRKLNIQKASVIRQFRRWNPNFLKYFYFKDGKWIPKLGNEGELERRKTTRKKGLRTKPFNGAPGELSPRQEDAKFGESSDNDETEAHSWAFHTTSIASKPHTSRATESTSISSSPISAASRKRRLDDDGEKG